MKTLTVHGSGRHLLARGRGGHDLLLARGSGWRDLLLALGRGSQADLVLGQSLLTKKHPYICNLIEVTIRLAAATKALTLALPTGLRKTTRHAAASPDSD